MKRTTLKLVPIFLLVITSVALLYPQKSRSLPPTSVKDTLSSSQLSYFGRISAPITAGDSIIKVGNTGVPSKSTNNLFVGDTIGIGTTGAGVGISGPLTLYTIQDIGNTQTLELNSAIGQSNAFINAAIIATRSAIHTISLTPQSNIAGGFWQFLIKATSRSGETNNDGIPDQQGFDLGQDVGSTTTGSGTRLKVADVTCPNWGVGVTTAYSIGTTIVGANTYHVITCYLGVGGTNQIGVGYTLSIGRDLATGSQLINPSASLSHVEGTADANGPDIYTFLVRHLDSSSLVIDADTAQGKIAVVEAVRVTATVDPTLTFSIGITGVGVGATPCGLAGLSSAAANTTATAVSFGSLNLAAANDLAQQLSCVTNATSGYVVTVYEGGPMKNIADGSTLADTNCNGGGCTASVGTTWATFTNSGWGYTIHNLSVGVTTLSYPFYRPFGNGSTNAQQVMKNTSTPTATEQAFVCYRVVASTTQKAGNYENKLIYTATATF